MTGVVRRARFALDIPRAVLVKQLVESGAPGGVFVIEGTVAEAAVEDADQPVGQGA